MTAPVDKNEHPACFDPVCLDAALSLMTLGARKMREHRELVETWIAAKPDSDQSTLMRRFVEISDEIGRQEAVRDEQIAAFRRRDSGDEAKA